MPMLSSASTAPIIAMNKVFTTGDNATKKSFKKFIFEISFCTTPNQVVYYLYETISAFK